MLAVSIIIPCLNEEKTITLLLQAIYNQTWPKADMEVIIADGLSIDQTRLMIGRFQQTHPDLTIRLVDNPRRFIPAALNIALATANGEFIIRLDAHSEPAPDYVERCVAALRDGKAEVVGGIWLIRPAAKGWLAGSIAAAAAHPLGVGDALYRFASQPALVDTVPFGAYRRSLLDRVGTYDETLLTNEDYEFNTRVRLAGGQIWLDPAIRSTYFARPTLAALARQYARYGYWKFQMLRRYPASIRWRQAIPPLFTLSLIALILLSPFWNLARILLVIELAVYLLALLAGSLIPALRAQKIGYLLGIPLAMATMHLAWGAGFLGSVVKSICSPFRG